MKIKHIIFLTLLCFSLVPLYLFGAFMLYENDRKVEMILREDLEAISGAQIMNIRNFCEARKESMQIIGRYDIVRDAVLTNLGRKDVQGGKITAEYLDNMLRERRDYNSFVMSVSIVDKNFRVVASSQDYTKFEKSGLKDTNEKYLTGDFFISDSYDREMEEGTKRVVAALQGIREEGEIVGYVVEEISVDYFDKYRSDTNLWRDGTFYLLDGNNVVLTAGNPGEDSREEFITTEEERESYQRKWEAIDQEKNPSGEFSYTIRGQEYITYYSDLDYTDWSIRVSVNLTSHKESVLEYRVLLCITILCVSLLLLVVNYILSRRLTRPVDCIVRTLKEVQAKQDYSLLIETQRRDELGILTEEVNGLLHYIYEEDLQEKEQQRLLARKAERDPLTGVKNKEAIEGKMQDVVQGAAEDGSGLVVGFIDIDNFRDYNTRYGHMEGDNVIRFVAAILQNEIPGEVGRVGGDEFAFCIPESYSRDAVEQLAKRILERLNIGTFNHETGRRMAVPCSIGIVICHRGELGYSMLLRAADEAMYQAKDKGKNTYQLLELDEDADLGAEA